MPVYLDNAATTKIDPRVLDKILPFLTDNYGNAASTTHVFGQQANIAVEAARQQVADSVGCDSKEIIFTSGATESSNLAIKGIAQFYRERGRHLITLKTEHKATLDTMAALELCGYQVTYLTPKSNGLMDIAELEQAIRLDTILISVAYVNSEIGVIQDIAAIGALCKDRHIYLHVDAAQAYGKLDFSVADLNVDLMSFSAHKIHGPKGVGALYLRRHPRVRLIPQIHGGGQERGCRAGTLPTHQIVGMGEAFMLAQSELATELPRIRVLRDKLYAGLKLRHSVSLNGDWQQRIPHNLNLSFKDIPSAEFMQINQDVVAVSSGSACASTEIEPSYVLRALGVEQHIAKCAIRFSLSRFTTETEINYLLEFLKFIQ